MCPFETAIQLNKWLPRVLVIEIWLSVNLRLNLLCTAFGVMNDRNPGSNRTTGPVYKTSAAIFL